MRREHFKMRWDDIPKFTRQGNYSVAMPWNHIEQCLARWSEDQPVLTDPDFQRAHVWTPEKQVAYVEYCMRGGYAAKEIYWNCSSWNKKWDTPIELVDGKQRLEAVRAFMRGEVKAFGCRFDEFDILDMMACQMRWYVNDLPTRAAVLQWYLDLNTGGVVHTQEELDKVRALLKAEEK